MNSEEIKQKHPADMSTNAWLREMCLQLAILNEKEGSKDVNSTAAISAKRDNRKRT